MSFKVIKPGFISSIQDLGRYSLGHLGIAQSGVADQHAFCWANYLLENDVNAAALEITFGGCELQAQCNTQIAITGADFDFRLNGKPQHNWQVIIVNKGDRLTWASSHNGVRAYLAVAGGFQTEVYFSSRSVNVREHIGQLIEAGDELACNTTAELAQLSRTIPARFKPDYQQLLTLRMLPSYQFDQFDPSQQQTLFNQIYEVDRGSDRTGCRLIGTAIENTPNTMISEGIAYGSVEITSAGLPIILLNDRPTIGGYPKIGTVLSLDLAMLAQRQAGAKVIFERIDIESAQQLRHNFNQFFGLNL